jgi:CHAT domain-containing protein/tetratricopeptide (TPR) repeat protein
MRQKLLRTLLLVLTLHAAPAALPPLHAAPAEPPRPSAEVLALMEKGTQARLSGRWEESLRLYNEALSKARSLSDKAGEGRTLHEMGFVYQNIGQPQRALEFYHQALPLFRSARDRRGEATTLGSIGSVYDSMGQRQKALEYYNQALPLHRAVQDKAGEAARLIDIGSVYVHLGQTQKALEFYNQALPLQRAVEERAGEAATLHNIGTVYNKTGQPQKALEFYNQALSLHRAVGDKAGEATTLNNIGSVYGRTGQPQKALEVHNQALLSHRAVGDKAGEAITLNSIGMRYSETGQPQKALEYYSQALPLCRTVGDRAGEAATLHNIGLLYSKTGQPQKALEYYSQALPLIQAVGDKAGGASTLNSIGGVYHATGQPQKALEFYNQALPLQRAVQGRAGEAATLHNIGHVYYATGQPQKALEFYNQALSLHRAVGDKAGEAITLSNVGSVYSDLGQPQKALEYFGQALPLQRAVGDRAGEANTLGNTAMAQEALGRPAIATRHLRDALTILEAMRQDLGGLSEAKVSFMASRLAYYHEYVHLLLKQNEPAVAFEWVEKSKARALLDLIAAFPAAITGRATAEELQRERELKAQVSRLNQQWVAEEVRPVKDKARIAALKRQLTRAESELQKFRDLLYARYPDVARKRMARTVTLADVARFLPPDTALLNYVVLNARDLDKTVLFCATVENGKPVMQAYPITQEREELAERVDDFREACASPKRDYRRKARELYALLLAPAAKQLTAKKRLIVCPDGPLWGLPFQALLTSKGAAAPTFLAERYEVNYGYSATAVQAALLARKDPKRPKPAGTMLAFANPHFGKPSGSPDQPGSLSPALPDTRPIIIDSRSLFMSGEGQIWPLPDTQVEADAIKADFPDAVIHTEKEAQEGTAKQEAGRYRYLHFATHGLLNDAAPLMSSVVLAQPPPGSEEDQFLTAREIFDLNLTAELVVLSACDTARGSKQAGEGVVGLTWALFAAGAPTQVVSQWAVKDASTAELMKQFYARLKQGQAKGAALRGAALALRQDRQYSHPYYWAPFILMGDWR